MRPNRQETADLVTITEGILNEKLHFFVAPITCTLSASGNYFRSVIMSYL